MPNIRRTAPEKLAILEAAKASGNIKAVCVANNLSQTVFYGWRRKFEAGGLPALEHKKRWVTHQSLPDFEVPHSPWIVKNLKRRSSLAGQPLSPWYNFDLCAENRWMLRRFSYNREFQTVVGYNERDERGRLYIVEPLGDVPRELQDAIQMQLDLEHY